MDESRNDLNGREPSYWRSLRELHDSGPVTDIKAHEFMSGVTDEFNLSDLSTMSRKQFLALLTASAAFAAAGCTNYRDKGEIVPYVKKPEESTPGVANLYASTCTGCAQSCGILIKTREGRPIKIDGNPDHPVNRGKICAKGQASILNLYDPNRLRKPARGSSIASLGDVSWKLADAEIRKHLEACTASGKTIALITHPISSPSAQKVLDDFVAKFPTTKVYVYDLVNDENRRRAWQRCYGTPEIPVIAWEKAEVILALESDFLGTEGSTIEQIRTFAGARDIMKSSAFNRLYCVEGAMSLTGANADYRIRLRPDFQAQFLGALINEIATPRGAANVDARLSLSAPAGTLKSFAEKNGLEPAILDRLAGDLLAKRGKSIVHAGNTLPESVHVAVNYLNELLGNTTLYDDGHADRSPGTLASAAELEALVRGMNAGTVGMVVHFGTNPAYHLPRGLGYNDALRKIPVSISMVESEDETAQWCTHVLPAHHAYESWGDFSTRTGITSLQQPVIAPLFDTRQKEAVLLTWMADDGLYKETVYHEFMLSRWEKEVFPTLKRKADFKSFWHSALHDGIVLHEAPASNPRRFDPAALNTPEPPAGSSGFVLALRENHYLGDGRFANNGWLQELPHPISKVVWDNYAAFSPSTAKDLGVEHGDLVEVSSPLGTLTIPAAVQPGLADRFITIELGYGRTNAGPIGSGVGADATVFLGPEGFANGRILRDVQVAKAAGKVDLVSTQEHHSLDDEFLKDLHIKREIIREGTVRQYEKDPEFIQHHRPELFSISKEVEYKGVKWAMAVDLNKCIGCNACVSGCNVENNVPVVGKEQVRKGREMQWIRIDRYYAGAPDSPSLSHQPMLCQHCDGAPCENVCPVVATSHSADGLNQMTYNRCVGTKYCSNNCPYKVRRFNFFDFRDHLADGYYGREPVSLVHNPEVTVRSRGVMEKCTFCVQRIMEARQHAAEQGRPLKGSDVKTACQDACPAQAIVFGDMNDPESDVSRYRKHNLGYHVLEEVNARPNVTYLARLRNTHSENVA
jgi:molybdopterin-containing oxidoreductase family iron-sulfur binding subunit